MFFFRKLFVGGLSWETSQDNLQRYFQRYGEVIDCVVMKNAESGRSRGFGFVTFADPQNVQVVLQSGPHTLDGRLVKWSVFSFYKEVKDCGTGKLRSNTCLRFYCVIAV